jgi:FlaA1/EpsC-like NDP-sugar epimerase
LDLAQRFGGKGLVIKIKFIGEREGEKGEEEMSISVSIWV